MSLLSFAEACEPVLEQAVPAAEWGRGGGGDRPNETFGAGAHLTGAPVGG
jgi:hypothetical protein